MLMKHVIFLEWLVWDTYEFETSHYDSYILPPCILTYAPLMSTICHYSEHDSTFYPYYISDDSFARLSSMIETMNTQQAEFANKIGEYDSSHETDLRFSFPKLDVCLCDAGASFSPLESGLEVALDPLLTTPSLVAPFSPSTFRDSTMLIMTFSDTPFPLTQSPEFEVGETLGINISVDEDDTYYESNHAFIEVHDFDVTLEGRLYVDAEVTVTTSPYVVENIFPRPP